MATFALTNSLAAFLAPWLVVLAGLAFGTVGGDSSRQWAVGQPHFGDWSRLLHYKRLLGMALCLMPIAACLLLTKKPQRIHRRGRGVVLVWLAVPASGQFASAGKRPSRWPRWRRRSLPRCWPPESSIARRLAQASKSFGYRLQYWQSRWR